MSAIRKIEYLDPDFSRRVNSVRDMLRGGGLTAAEASPGQLDIPRIVADILEQVQSRGDRAAAELTSKLDRAQVTPQTLRVSEEAIVRAHAQADASFLDLIRASVANLRAYQEHIMVRAPEPLLRDGRKLGVRYLPIDRVGVYVPGGQALYPSTVLMTVVPAQVAGVPEIVMTSPPTDGDINPLALALAKELGIREVYRLGGAVAIAALAFGTDRVRPVHKIVGPGNAFVAEAKRQLFGRVGIDSIAGPSEVLIVADDSANPQWVAADLLAQAEHNPGSAILATPSRGLAEQVQAEVDAQLANLERAEVTRFSLERYSAILVTENLQQACELANDFATEHLHIVTRDNQACLAQIRHGGAIFIGPHTPVPLGDYFAGPSHVLPTGGTAKFFSALSCNDFLKASSTLEYSRASVAEDAESVVDFALREGLTAHAAAVRIRVRR
jgi:histidinol dehydrogenase